MTPDCVEAADLTAQPTRICAGGYRCVGDYPTEGGTRVIENAPDPLAGAADAAELTRAQEIQLRYAAIVESSDDAIIAKTLDGVISAWNPAAERMFGYTEREAIGQPIAMIIPSDLHGEEDEILRRLRAGERIDHYETVRVTRTGERLDVSLTISPLRDPAGTIIGCSKIARDITKVKQAGAALWRSEQRLTREVAGAKTLQSISTRLISESTPESLYHQLLRAAMELMGSDAACLQMLAVDNTSLKLLAWANFHPDCVPFWERVAIGSGSTCSKAFRDQPARRCRGHRIVRIHGGHAGTAGISARRGPRRPVNAVAIANRPAARHALDALADAAYFDRR